MEQDIELTAESLWSEVVGRLRGSLNESTYRTWFGEAEGRGVTDTWRIGTGRGRHVIWERLHVLAPTGIYSPPARVTVNCR